jgi:hypothetical protein
MYEIGLSPIKSSDYYFGQYKPELQYVFDTIVNRLSETDMAAIADALKDFDFVYKKDNCRKEFGNFLLKIYQKNMYGSYILALQDLDEKVAVHWALKLDTLKETVAAVMKIYERWKEDSRGRDEECLTLS